MPIHEVCILYQVRHYLVILFKLEWARLLQFSMSDEYLMYTAVLYRASVWVKILLYWDHLRILVEIVL